MSAQPKPSTRVVFGPYELDPAKGEVRKHGVRLHFSRQPLQVLLALLSRPGELVTRQQLQSELWSDGTFVDFEHSLNAAVNKLRQTLNDSADYPRFIETIPGRGYRFIGPVENQLPTAPAQLSVAPAIPRSRPVWWAWLGGAVAIVGLLSAVLFLTFGTAPPEGSKNGPLRFRIPAPSGVALQPSGARQGFALSPDGNRLAFTAQNPDGTSSVWIRDFSAIEPFRVPNVSGVHAVFWSPDGRYLYFTNLDRLERCAPDGGSCQTVYVGIHLALLGTAFIDGKLMFTDRRGTWMLPSAGGPAQPVSNSRLLWPHVLPGRRLLYTTASTDGHYQIRAARLPDFTPIADIAQADSQAIFVPSRRRSGGYLLYTRAGTLVARGFDPGNLSFTSDEIPLVEHAFSFYPTGALDVSVGANGALVYLQIAPQSRLVWLDRSGQEVESVGAPVLPSKYVRLSRDRKNALAVMYDHKRSATELWTFDLVSGDRRRLPRQPGTVDTAVWSPDNRQIALGRAVAGPPRLFTRGTGEGDVEQPLPEGGFQLATDWTPDGRFVAFTNASFPSIVSERYGDVWLADVTQGRRVIPFLNSQFHEMDASFSPDGKWVAYLSNDSGQLEAYVRSFEEGGSPRAGAEKTIVSRAGALSVRWRGDGKEIYFVARDGFVYAVPLSFQPKFSPGSPVRLFQMRAQDMALLPTAFSFDVSADGKRFLIARALGESSFHVIQNWESLVESRR